ELYQPKYKKITRSEFVDICNDAIIKTKKDIVPGNQLTGYKTFHGAVKNNYVTDVLRENCNKINLDYGFSFFNSHKAIKYAGLGFCNEFAIYLCQELRNKFSELDVKALIMKAGSKTWDHAYLRIKIKLKNETMFSMWEIDAWDPRIIDVTKAPDGTIKNEEFLTYGKKPEIESIMNTMENDENAIPGLRPNFDVPEPGEPEDGSATPERKMIAKNTWLYSDCTLQKAYERELLPKNGKMTVCQKVSAWQKEQTEQPIKRLKK
ncbi:MAG: hypothetical protein JO149_07285, partial [Gammaproteobacteria bacterium]|nr:hypothetical protein [Gammaproteobacteria bacterium]